jgi:hypothetical protein
MMSRNVYKSESSLLFNFLLPPVTYSRLMLLFPSSCCFCVILTPPASCYFLPHPRYFLQPLVTSSSLMLLSPASWYFLRLVLLFPVSCYFRVVLLLPVSCNFLQTFISSSSWNFLRPMLLFPAPLLPPLLTQPLATSSRLMLLPSASCYFLRLVLLLPASCYFLQPVTSSLLMLPPPISSYFRVILIHPASCYFLPPYVTFPIFSCFL